MREAGDTRERRRAATRGGRTYVYIYIRRLKRPLIVQGSRKRLIDSDGRAQRDQLRGPGESIVDVGDARKSAKKLDVDPGIVASSGSATYDGSRATMKLRTRTGRRRRGRGRARRAKRRRAQWPMFVVRARLYKCKSGPNT